MPHPEHAVEPGYGPDRDARHRQADGLGFFTSVAQARSGRGRCMTPTVSRSTPSSTRPQTPGRASSRGPSWASNRDEYPRIREILGRRPTSAELAMYSVMWSEHCSYKSSKVHLRQFGDKTTDAMRKKLLVGIGENAGVVDIGDGWAVTFKVESHNHPPTWSRTRARPPASAASCATSCPWAPARSR